MTADEELCPHCYGTMSSCPVCGDPPEYAESLVVGGQRDAGLWVDGFALYGAGLDHADTANQSGWCWRDTDAVFGAMYAQSAKLVDLISRPSPLMVRLAGGS